MASKFPPNIFFFFHGYGYYSILFFFFFFFFFLSTSLTSPSTTSAAVAVAVENNQERQILLEIKNACPSLASSSSWNSSSDHHHCNWTGIECNEKGYVQGINLSSQNITCSPSIIIPIVCGGLGSLGSLDLSDNDLTGEFPTSLYNCTSLSYLDLSQNYLVGRLPPDLHRMSSTLSSLHLSANNFTGQIPPSIPSSLTSLFLDDNLFDGTLPSHQIANLSNLQSLALAYNPFSPQSRIPPEYGNLTNLGFLWMTNCNLVGAIPEDLFNKNTLLRHLDLAENSLTGSIPPTLWTLQTNLQYLYLYKNNLTGGLIMPNPIQALGLRQIDVSINGLTGPIPEDLGNLRNLTLLFIYFNRFSGEIPVGIGLLPSLTDLRLFNNRLTGVLPPQLGIHSKLWNLEVDDNLLSGELPPDLCANGALNSLVVFDNNFTGTIPPSLGSCSTLENIQIHRNKFSGKIPDGLWSAGTNLSTVILRGNNLSGTLPDNLPWNLTRLDIQKNRFSGRIPSRAGNLLVFLAGDNSLSGEILNITTGMPKLQSLSLGGNLITGKIPPEMALLTSLTDLNLSYNRLTGEIPPSVGILPVLTFLDLSNNELTGPIPQSFGNMKLNFLNLSCNQLSGQVPIPLQNQAYGQSFLSNPGLCSAFNLPSCTGGDAKGTGGSSSVIRITFVVLGAVFFAIAAVVTLLLLIVVKQRRASRDDLVSWKFTSFRTLDFNESTILRGLTNDRVIGSGGSGKVYRVDIGGGAGRTAVVAVKKIWNSSSSRKLDPKAEREFQSEVNILGSIRHSNIVKLLCCISSAESKLLVYEYMANGSLDMWLHKKKRGEGGGGGLDWPRRLRIAIGAAHGLSYMHHDCSPPIVHRDVKSSNILLDSEFRPKVADFGLARILLPAKPPPPPAQAGGEEESVSSSCFAGSFGYMAPECAYASKLNEKMDVYSFGVVLLELTTGREASASDGGGGLVDWAWGHFQEGKKAIDAIDEAIIIRGSNSYLDEIANVLKLGLICTGTLPSTRPTMKDVVQILLRYDRTTENNNARGDKPQHQMEYDESPLLQTSSS